MTYIGWIYMIRLYSVYRIAYILVDIKFRVPQPIH